MKKYYVSYLLLGVGRGIGAGCREVNVDEWTSETVDNVKRVIEEFPANASRNLTAVIISWQELKQ